MVWGSEKCPGCEDMSTFPILCHYTHMLRFSNANMLPEFLATWTHASAWASLNSVNDVLSLLNGRETLRAFVWDSRSGFRKWFDSPDTWMKLVQFGYSCVTEFRFNTWNVFSRLSQQVMATEIITQVAHLQTQTTA